MNHTYLELLRLLILLVISVHLIFVVRKAFLEIELVEEAFGAKLTLNFAFAVDALLVIPKQIGTAAIDSPQFPSSRPQTLTSVVDQGATSSSFLRLLPQRPECLIFPLLHLRHLRRVVL